MLTKITISFKEENLQTQYNILSYRIELYSHDYKLINAKIANSGKKCPVDVTDPYLISIPPFTLSLPLHSKYFRGNSLVVKTHLNVLQIQFVGILISRKDFGIKVGQRLCIVFQY